MQREVKEDIVATFSETVAWQLQTSNHKIFAMQTNQELLGGYKFKRKR